MATHFDREYRQPLVVQEIPNLKESSSRMGKTFFSDLNESIRPGREEERYLGRAPASVGQACLQLIKSVNIIISSNTIILIIIRNRSSTIIISQSSTPLMASST